MARRCSRPAAPTHEPRRRPLESTPRTPAMGQPMHAADATLPDPFAASRQRDLPEGHRPQLRGRPTTRPLVDALVANDAIAWREFQQRYDRLIMRCITKVTKSFSAVSHRRRPRDLRAAVPVALRRRPRQAARLRPGARQLAFELRRHARHPLRLRLAAGDPARAPARGHGRRRGALRASCPTPTRPPRRTSAPSLAARVMEGFSERDRIFATLYFGEGMEPERDRALDEDQRQDRLLEEAQDPVQARVDRRQPQGRVRRGVAPGRPRTAMAGPPRL